MTDQDDPSQLDEAVQTMIAEGVREHAAFMGRAMDRGYRPFPSAAALVCDDYHGNHWSRRGCYALIPASERAIEAHDNFHARAGA